MNLQMKGSRELKNWSGHVSFRPDQIVLPKSEDEIADILKSAKKSGKTVRVVGTGHSFSPLIATKDILLSLDHLQGVIENSSSGVTVWGGTKLKRLGKLLLDLGLGMENLGDIDAQSIAGTISTGTHGTGTNFGTIATQVTELTLITVEGDRMVCSSETNPDLFKAALTSLGSLGIITRVKIRATKAFKLKFTQGKESLLTCVDKLDLYNKENRNFEFYYFPHTDVVQTKFVNLTEEDPDVRSIKTHLNDVFVENTLFRIISEVSRWVPGATIPMAKLCGWGVSPITKKDWGYRIFAVPRLVKFNEMEYNIPHEKMKDAILEASECINSKRHQVHFPIECRFVKGDDIWLSPAYGRNSAYLAVHMFKGMEYKKYFEDLENIFKRYDGRPHWGKMHTRTAVDLSKLYPKWNDFLQVRAKLDPSATLLSPYMKTIFGV